MKCEVVCQGVWRPLLQHPPHRQTQVLESRMSTIPRKPLVPGPTPQPSPGGIAGRAIATREQVAQERAPGRIVPATNGQPPATQGDRFFRERPAPVGHIAGAIADVMSKVGTIEKRGKNEYFGYKYARMEDLLYAITPLM